MSYHKNQNDMKLNWYKKDRMELADTGIFGQLAIGAFGLQVNDVGKSYNIANNTFSNEQLKEVANMYVENRIKGIVDKANADMVTAIEVSEFIPDNTLEHLVHCIENLKAVARAYRVMLTIGGVLENYGKSIVFKNENRGYVSIGGSGLNLCFEKSNLIGLIYPRSLAHKWVIGNDLKMTIDLAGAKTIDDLIKAMEAHIESLRSKEQSKEAKQ